MFDTIVPTYDLLNHVLSLGTDLWWRKNIFSRIQPVHDKNALDMACGTGDLSRLLAKKGARVTALDFSFPMLQKARRKRVASHFFVAGDAGAQPLSGDTFEIATIAFGIRNIPDIDVFMKEAFRVLAPGGELAILELVRPANRLVSFFYKFYLGRLLPLVGGIISGKPQAYRYLAETIATFIDPIDLVLMLRRHGFTHTGVFPQRPGMAVIITARKEAS